MTAPLSGKIRFVGFGDDVLIVRFNGKNVLDASWLPTDPKINDRDQTNIGKERDAAGSRTLVGGDWFQVEKGQQYPMEILIGESPGGHFRCFLMVQDKGTKYPMRSDGSGFAFPVFQSRSISMPDYDQNRSGPEVAKQALVFQ